MKIRSIIFRLLGWLGFTEKRDSELKLEKPWIDGKMRLSRMVI